MNQQNSRENFRAKFSDTVAIFQIVPSVFPSLPNPFCELLLKFVRKLIDKTQTSLLLLLTRHQVCSSCSSCTARLNKSGHTSTKAGRTLFAIISLSARNERNNRSSSAPPFTSSGTELRWHRRSSVCCSSALPRTPPLQCGSGGFEMGACPVLFPQCLSLSNLRSVSDFRRIEQSQLASGCVPPLARNSSSHPNRFSLQANGGVLAPPCRWRQLVTASVQLSVCSPH